VRRAVCLVFATAAAAVACSGGDDGDRTVTVTPPPAPATVVAPVDAPPGDGSTTLPDTDPSLHLDEGDVTVASDPLPPRARSRRLLEIILRSTPSGATAVVDGKVVGVTPTYWEGEFTGRARDFTFVLPGHTLGRYKFVPIQNGIVHARLTPVLSLPGAAPPVIVPPLPPPPPEPETTPTPKPRPSPAAAVDAPTPPPADAADVPSTTMDAAPVEPDALAAPP
jgi:hypothetical protein